MNNEEQKNIRITLDNPEEKEKGAVISFEKVLSTLRRFLSLWLVFAIIVGIITAGIVLITSRSTSTDMITALISFKYDGIEKGNDPDGKEFDINKVKSPNIIEEAMTNISEPVERVESVRRNISIDGVVPGEALDKISLYQKLFVKSGNIDTANALLGVEYYPSYYIVRFDSSSAGYDMEMGKNIIDEILHVYQSYFFKTYGYNKALGNSLAAVDYKEYDYSAAVDIFKTTLDDLQSYVTNISANDSTSFRSSKTGYNFSDILSNIKTIREADLDSVSSYITINNITDDRDRLLAYYEFKIENMEREAQVMKAELDSVSRSIDNYQKDKMMIFGDMEDEDDSYSQVSKKYDELIRKKTTALTALTQQEQKIEYYRARLDAVKDNNVSSTESDNENVEDTLEKIYSKIETIIDITERTSNDYYENVVFKNAFNILVPATGDEHIVQLGNFALPVIGAEGAVFMIYLIASVIIAIVEYNKQHKKTEETA